MKRIPRDELLDVVGMYDPNSGKMLANNAQSAIVVVGQNEDGCAFVLDEWAGRTSSTEAQENMYRLNRIYRCKRFGVDATGQQYLYFTDLVKEANVRREPICLVPREMPSTEKKEFRLTTTIQQWMHNGLLYVNENCKQLLKQLERFPSGTVVDLVDALAEALRMMRNPLSSRRPIEYDPDYDETERWKKTIRQDYRYGGFARR